MNISSTSLGITSKNTQSFRMVGAGEHTAEKAKEQAKDDKKGSTAAVLSISNKDRSVAITKRFQGMKENLQKQIGVLNEKLAKASESGNTKLEEQLAENIKSLTSDFSALDEQLSAALFEEEQRKIEENKKKEEEAMEERKKAQKKHKPDEEKIKDEEKKSFEFFTKSDKTKESLHNSRAQKASLERSKARLESEMATDGYILADKNQRMEAQRQELQYGKSFVPYVSDKTISTERRRIAAKSFTPDEDAKVEELNKLNAGIDGLERSALGSIKELNDAVKDRTKDIAESNKTEKPTEQEKSEEAKADGSRARDDAAATEGTEKAEDEKRPDAEASELD